jgi:hypothetical protein
MERHGPKPAGLIQRFQEAAVGHHETPQEALADGFG